MQAREAAAQAGPYALVSVLSRGPAATLYLARDTRSGLPAAVKMLAPQAAGELADEIGERFAREAGAARRLAHPGIVALLDQGVERGRAWIAMELLPGHDLARHTGAAQRLPPGEVLEIAIQLAQALAHAHRRGVVHRDLKPSNVIYDPATGRARLTDFGIARVADASRTRTGVVLGTPAYMSPEQIAGLAVDGRSDLYALGVLLFELLCSRPPFQAPTLGALMQAVAREPAPALRSLRPELPEALEALVARLLAKRPGERPADGGEVALALRAAASSVTYSRADPMHNSGDRPLPPTCAP